MRYLLLVGLCVSAAVASADEWKRPVIIPKPDRVKGCRESVVSLNGTWKFTLNPPTEFWENDVDPSEWSDVTVPGEPWMQGLRIERDREYPYKKQITIPRDFSGQRILLRFDGVYSVGRVWVNGQFTGQHYGGFQSWNLDITDKVAPGKSAWVTVGITDLTHDLSFASGYASRYLGTNDMPHFIGGILRNVSLVAVPTVHITSLHVTTDLDADYCDATLKTDIRVSNDGADESGPVVCRLSLRKSTAASGRQLLSNIEIGTIEIGTIRPGPLAIQNHSSKIEHPDKWDAEHPNLYVLTAELMVAGEIIETVSKRFGFREIEVRGTQLLVNGRRVKLRGGCRHSVHPVAGRAYVPELADKDVRLYKEANINYIRTSHYPTSEHFLNLCDQYGIYVEEEMAIVWLDHGAAKGKLNNMCDAPATLPYFLRAISETLERDKSHPSIIIWSLGNENAKWGINFEKERDYARSEDPTRPLKTGHNAYRGWNTAKYLDIDSYHYPVWNSDFSKIKSGKPFLADEYAHVMCYYGRDSIAERDPNIRNFWGESLKRFWDAMYPADTVLGGAIWGTIDEVFLCPERPVGYGRWGIIDGWRRKKPEHWNTKKAYSPVRIENKPLGNPGAGKPLRIAVKNWFDHTDFNELDITWQVGEKTGRIDMSLPPAGTAGTLTLPAQAWEDSDVVQLTFLTKPPAMRRVVNTFRLPLAPSAHPTPALHGPAPKLSVVDNRITVSGKSFSLVFDKQTGQIVEGVSGGELLLTGGPVLNLTPMTLAPLHVKACRADLQQAVGSVPCARIAVSGAYGEIGFDYVLSIDGSGRMKGVYTVTRPPSGKPAYDEVGVTFFAPPSIDRLAWQREGLWSTYPEDHIGRNRGIAVKMRAELALTYRHEPTWPWYHDMEDFHLRGKDHQGYGMTHDFRAAKEYIDWAELYRDGAPARLRIDSDGKTQAVRVARAEPKRNWLVDDRHASVKRFGSWKEYTDRNDLSGTELYSDQKGDSVECLFSGTSVAWISARNNNLGKADVYLDGQCVALGVDAYGPNKQWAQVLFQKTGLPKGEHRIRIVVTGKKHPDSDAAHVLIDGFADVPMETKPALELHINRGWIYQLGWGNYGRNAPKLNTGFTDTVWLRLAKQPATDFRGEETGTGTLLMRD